LCAADDRAISDKECVMSFSLLRAIIFLPPLLILTAPPALADGAPAQRLLTVSGSGEVRAAPDRAELSTGVVTRERSAAAALAGNARAMNAVFETLKHAGAPEKDIQTSNFQVLPQYAAEKPGTSAPQRIVGYEVSNTVNVTVEGLDKLGPTIDALVAAGSNQIDGPSFSIADPKPLLAKAREEAVKDAVARAQAYAHAAGVTLGPIAAIYEGGGATTIQPAGRMMSMLKSPTPIAAGEESVAATVSISWEIH
jgi:uncharacterized protein YggE